MELRPTTAEPRSISGAELYRAGWRGYEDVYTYLGKMRPNVQAQIRAITTTSKVFFTLLPSLSAS